jgi:hypothetical protein
LVCRDSQKGQNGRGVRQYEEEEKYIENLMGKLEGNGIYSHGWSDNIEMDLK